MLVVELTDGSTFDCTGYDEADKGLEFTYNDDFKAYAPYGNVRCIHRADAPGDSPASSGSAGGGDNSNNNSSNENDNNSNTNENENDNDTADGGFDFEN